MAEDEHASVFFEHVGILSEEYERLAAENAKLKAALAELAQAQTSPEKDVELSTVAPVLVAEAFHGTEEADKCEVDTNNQQELEHSDNAPSLRLQASSTLNSIDSKAPGGPRVDRFGTVDWDAMPEKEIGRHAIFNQGQRLKAAIADDMLAEMRYDVKQMYKTTGCWQYIARHQWFENFTMFVIVSYALYMSFDTDLNTADIITETHPVFIVCEQVFCMYFFLELVIRFMAFEKKCNSFKDAWFVFDFALVFMMVAETWVMNLIILFMASGGAPNFLGDASILRIARLLRLTRLLRMARLIRFFPELLIMVKAVASATRSVGFTLILLGICLYVFAIMFKTMLVGTNIGETYFKHVPLSMHSLFMHGTFLDSVSELMMDMLDESPLGFALMYVFIILSAVTIMNMLIGVLCEVITAVADAEKEALQVSWTTEVLQTCLSLGADENNDGCIDFDEFQHMVSNAKVRKVLKEADVDVQTLINFVDVLFESDGPDGDLQKLPFSEFMDRLLKLRGSNTATVKDLVDLRKWMTKEFSELRLKVREAMTQRRETTMRSNSQRPTLSPTLAAKSTSEIIMQV